MITIVVDYARNHYAKIIWIDVANAFHIHQISLYLKSHAVCPLCVAFLEYATIVLILSQSFVGRREEDKMSKVVETTATGIHCISFELSHCLNAVYNSLATNIINLIPNGSHRLLPDSSQHLKICVQKIKQNAFDHFCTEQLNNNELCAN